MTNPAAQFPEAEDLPTIMIAAFEGWNDAGSAASAALLHLHDVWQAEEHAVIDADEYYDLQVNRPTIGNDDDGNRVITWPTTVISRAVMPGTGQPVLLVHGIEPSLHWRRYCRELLALASDSDVETLVCLGALLADVPHTRPLPVNATSEDEIIREVYGVEASHYEGPTGIIAVLQDAAAQQDISSMSVWAAVPHYVAHPPSPKASLALVRKLDDLFATSIDVTSLEEDAEAWQAGVDSLAAEDNEIFEYVEQLEEATDTADLPEASGEAIALEFERFLRRRDEGKS